MVQKAYLTWFLHYLFRDIIFTFKFTFQNLSCSWDQILQDSIYWNRFPFHVPS